MSPVFHQAWHLFAPDPPLKSKTMQFRVFKNGQWHNWVDSESQLLEAHDRWRLGNANIRYRIHQNTAHRLWEENTRAETVREYKNDADFSRREYLVGSGGYRTATFFCRQLAAGFQEFTDPDSLEVRLIVGTPPRPNESNGTWHLDTLKYPATHVQD